LTESIKLSRDFKSLCFHETIISLASGMIGLFLPIFLLQKFGNSIFWVVMFYLIGYLLYALLVPFGAMIMSRIGLKKSMISGIIFLLLFYLCLYFFKNNPILFSILANISLLIYRVLYWIPYHVDFAQFTDGKYRGRQMAYLAVLGYLVSIGAPLFAGFILNKFAFEFLFILTLIVIAFSIFPIKRLSKVEAKYEFSYLQTFKELFKKSNYRFGLAYLSDGAQDLTGAIIWPIFIFLLLDSQYLAVGAISALITIASVILQLFAGSFTDKFSKKKMMRAGSIFYALGWIAKAFVVTTFEIFIAGAFHSFMSIIMRAPFDALRYEQLADHGAYMDEYTVLREISLSLGRVLMGVLLIILIGSFGFQFAFVLSAIFSLMINLI
jgi:YQGE family putative transporter